MKTFFSIRRNFSRKAVGLKMSYSLDDVPDTLVLNKPSPTPRNFLNSFSYAKVDGIIMEDILANNMGWYTVSGRIAKLLKNCSNYDDLELLPFPRKVTELDERFADYFVLGIKREILCVNVEKSDILWGSAGTKQKHILSFRDCVLNERDIPDNMDLFLMAEYPVVPVMSSRLTMEIANLYPTGFVVEKIVAI